MAVRSPNGWRRGERTLGEVAAQVDGFDRYNQYVAVYRAHREDWRTFLGSCGPLAAALAGLEAALAEQDRRISMITWQPRSTPNYGLSSPPPYRPTPSSTSTPP